MGVVDLYRISGERQFCAVLAVVTIDNVGNQQTRRVTFLRI